MKNLRFFLSSSDSSPLMGEDKGGGDSASRAHPYPGLPPSRGKESDTEGNARYLVLSFFFIFLVFISFATNASAQLKKIRLCAPGVGSGIMHTYVAKERGYFAQEGIDLEVLVARGQICTMALLNGQMEFSSNPNIFDAMVAGKFKGKMIYVSAKTLGHRFIVAPEIKDFNGVKQKHIAVSTFGGLTDMLTREILEQHGLNPAKDVVLLQVGTPDVRYSSLKAGVVKAALLSSTGGLQALQEGYRELPYHQPPWLSSPITVSDELLARERATLRGFLRAAQKGHLYYGKYPAAAMELIRKVQRIDSRALAKQIYDDDMSRHNPTGSLEDASMRKVTERARDMLKVPRLVDINEVFDLSLAREVEAELKKTKWEP
jgi:NitT/TauT family transport system substrate-binding protein